MANENKEQLPPPKEEKGKRIFFLQVKDDFFESEEITIIKQIAEDLKFNENDCTSFWLKLMTRSLANEAIIERGSNLPVTPRFLKSFLNFKSSSEDDLKFIEDFVQALAEEKLITILSDGSFFIPMVETLTLSRSEEAERIRVWRQKKVVRKKEIAALNQGRPLDPENEFYNYFTKSFAGLFFKGYAKKNDEEIFKEVFKELWLTLKEEFIEYATEDFINNRLTSLHYETIKDKANYMKVTIQNFCKDRKHIYFQMEKWKHNDISEAEFKRISEIASYDWAHDFAEGWKK